MNQESDVIVKESKTSGTEIKTEASNSSVEKSVSQVDSPTEDGKACDKKPKQGSMFLSLLNFFKGLGKPKPMAEPKKKTRKEQKKTASLESITLKEASNSVHSDKKQEETIQPILEDAPENLSINKDVPEVKVIPSEALEEKKSSEKNSSQIEIDENTLTTQEHQSIESKTDQKQESTSLSTHLNDSHDESTEKLSSDSEASKNILTFKEHIDSPQLKDEASLSREETPLQNEVTPLQTEEARPSMEEVPLQKEDTPLHYEETPQKEDLHDSAKLSVEDETHSKNIETVETSES